MSEARELQALLRAYAEAEPPPLSPEAEDRLITSVLDEVLPVDVGAAQADDDLLASVLDEVLPLAPDDDEPIVAPRAGANRSLWWALAALALLTFGTTARLSALHDTGAPLALSAATDPNLIVLEAQIGMRFQLVQGRPVDLDFQGRRVHLEGEGAVQVTAMEPPEIVLEQGELNASWSPVRPGPLRVRHANDAVDVHSGTSRVAVKGEHLAWQIVEGQADAAPGAPKLRVHRHAPTEPRSPDAEPRVRLEPAAPVAPEAVAPTPADEGTEAPPAALPPAPTAESMYRDAELAIASGDITAASRSLDTLRAEWPDSPTAEVALIELARLHKQDDPRRAVADALAYQVLYPDGRFYDEAARLAEELTTPRQGTSAPRVVPLRLPGLHR